MDIFCRNVYLKLIFVFTILSHGHPTTSRFIIRIFLFYFVRNFLFDGLRNLSCDLFPECVCSPTSSAMIHISCDSVLETSTRRKCVRWVVLICRFLLEQSISQSLDFLRQTCEVYVSHVYQMFEVPFNTVNNKTDSCPFRRYSRLLRLVHMMSQLFVGMSVVGLFLSCVAA